MTAPIRVLYVDDSPLDRDLVRDALEKEAQGFSVVEAGSQIEFESHLAEGGYDLVLSDFNILGYQGLQVIDTVRAHQDHTPVIIITGTGSEEVAVEALKRGAADYLLKSAQSFRRLPLTIRAVLDRCQRDKELQRLDRELRAVSRCNQVLMRADDEPTLLDDVCRIVCEEAGYRLAWVGYAELDESKSVRPIAWAGTDKSAVEEAGVTWAADGVRGSGPTGAAIRSARPEVVQDTLSDPRMAPWKDTVDRCGYRSALGLPLLDEDGLVFGALTIFSTEPNAFSPSELRLLEELAGDLAFGIRTLRMRAERTKAMEALRALNEELEERVRARTAELLAINQELEKMNRLFVGRELKMAELKRRIASLEGRPR